MAPMFEGLPTDDSVTHLRPEELASHLLMHLAGDAVNRRNFLLAVTSEYGPSELVSKAFLAAWSVLVRRGHLVEKGDPAWFFVSDDGEEEKARLRAAGLPRPTRMRVVGGRWTVVESLAGGGQGVTWLVRAKGAPPDERFVLKELKGSDDQARQRFATETRALSALEHPHILRIVDFDVDATPPWYVTEYCASRGLDKALLSEMPVPTRLRVFLDVCRALAAAHEKGITHRDIKPENVLLRSPNGPAVLGDFGICWFADAEEERLTLAHEDIGSSFCRAPELFDGPARVTPASDIYCLGKLLYWILVGKGGRGGRLRTEEFDRSDKDLVAMFDDARYEHINVVLRRMVREDVSARYKNASEALDACTNAFNLFLNGFEPLDRAPQGCSYCGRDKYFERNSRSGNETELGLWQKWRVYECHSCGHTLMFRKNAVNTAW